MLYNNIKQLSRFCDSLPSYSAYPTKRKETRGNVDTINIDTLERNLRLVDRKTSNSSS